MQRATREPLWRRLGEAFDWTSPPRRLGIAVDLVAAAVFAVVLFERVSDWRRETAPARWPEVPCEIVSAEPGVWNGGEKDGKRAFIVRYRYEAGGRTRESERWSLRNPVEAHESVRDEAALSEAFPAGGRAVCRVDPDHPDESVLALDPPDAWVVAWSCALLGWGVAMGLVSAWGFFAGKADFLPVAAAGGIVIGMLPLAAGCLFRLATAAWPAVEEARAAAEWPLAEGVVRECTLDGGRRGRPSDPDRLYVSWDYEWDGVRRAGDNVCRIRTIAPATFRGDAFAFAQAHPAGAPVSVRVDPADPSYSRLDLPAPGRAAYAFDAAVCQYLALAALGIIGVAAPFVALRRVRPSAPSADSA